MESMTFEAQKKGGHANSVGGDLYVSLNCAGGDRMSLCIRFSAETLDALRWRIGDRVLLHLDKEGDHASWTITRTEDDNGKGLKISGNGRDEGCGSVRRRVNGPEAAFVFGRPYQPYTCFLLRGDNKQAVFNKMTEDNEND
jgi:hypothetical protein